LPFYRTISAVTSNHSWSLPWFQQWRGTNRYVWLDIYPGETTSCDLVYYRLSPMEKLNLPKHFILLCFFSCIRYS